MVGDRTVDAPCDAAEPPEVGDDGERDDTKGNRFCALGEIPGPEYEVVEHVGCHEDGKVERREIVVDVGYAPHDQERQEVQHPAK